MGGSRGRAGWTFNTADGPLTVLRVVKPLNILPGIVESLERNRRSGLESSRVSSGIAVLAWNRRESRAESPFRPGIVEILKGIAVLAWDRRPVSRGIAALA